MKTYKVIHFTPTMKSGLLSAKGEAIENQLATIINEQASDGWEFVSYQTSHVEVSPGCLASLFGRKTDHTYYDIMIFAKEKN